MYTSALVADPLAERISQHAARILIVEDEPMVAEVAERYLRRDGHDVMVAGDGISAVERFQVFQPDLIVLDLMLPARDGFEVCREVRSRSDVPIIMLTARGDELDRLLGLEAGADDYVTKPFSPRELAARVKAVLRRTRGTGSQSAATLDFGDLRIDSRTRGVQTVHGPAILTAKEFELLHFLASSPKQVFTRTQLLDQVWDFEFPGDESTVTVHVHRLRSKVEVDASRPRHVKTVWGVGYKFEP